MLDKILNVKVLILIVSTPYPISHFFHNCAFYYKYSTCFKLIRNM